MSQGTARMRDLLTSVGDCRGSDVANIVVSSFAQDPCTRFAFCHISSGNSPQQDECLERRLICPRGGKSQSCAFCYGVRHAAPATATPFVSE